MATEHISFNASPGEHVLKVLCRWNHIGELWNNPMWDSRCIDCIITPVLLYDPAPLPSPKHPKKVHAHMIRHCTVLVPRFKSIFRIGEGEEKKKKKPERYPPTRPRQLCKPMVDSRRAWWRRRQECDREAFGRLCACHCVAAAGSESSWCLSPAAAHRKCPFESPSGLAARCAFHSDSWAANPIHLLLSPPSPAPDPRHSLLPPLPTGSLLLHASLSSENHPTIFLFARARGQRLPPTPPVLSGLSPPHCNNMKKKEKKKEATVWSPRDGRIQLAPRLSYESQRKKKGF